MRLNQDLCTGNRRGSHPGQRWGKLLAFIIGLGLLSPVTACDLRQDNGFPALPTITPGLTSTTTLPSATSSAQPADSSTSGTSASGLPSDQRVTLRIAGPWSADTLYYLRLLYLARQSGQLHQSDGQTLGDVISLSDLAAYDDERFQVELIALPPDTGATRTQLRSWQATGSLPDLIYVTAAQPLLAQRQLLDLLPYLADDKRLAANQAYPALLTAHLEQGKLLGLPYLVTVPLVYYNSQIFSQYGLGNPVAPWTWTEFLTLCSQLQSAFARNSQRLNQADLKALENTPDLLQPRLQTAQFALANPQQLLNYLPAGSSLTLNLATWDGRRLNYDGQPFRDAVVALRQLVQDGYSPLHLTAGQAQQAFAGNDPAESGRLAMWIDDSAQLKRWMQQSRILFYFTQLPTRSEPVATASLAERQLALRQPVSLRSVVVTNQGPDPALAADFAAFLTLDSDSLLLQARLQQYEGYYPAVADQAVWQDLVAPQINGAQMLRLRNRLAYAYTGGQLWTSQWPEVMSQTIESQGDLLLTEGDYLQRLATWQKIADSLISIK